MESKKNACYIRFSIRKIQINVCLTPELERFIADKLETGLYQTASEVVREALRMFRQQDESRLEQLRGDIRTGFDDIERGEFLLLIPALE